MASVALSVASVGDLDADGKIGVTMTITNQMGNGDGFAFADSTLVASVEKAAAVELTEPGTLAMASLCLAVLGFSRRRG